MWTESSEEHIGKNNKKATALLVSDHSDSLLQENLHTQSIVPIVLGSISSSYAAQKTDDQYELRAALTLWKATQGGAPTSFSIKKFISVQIISIQ